MWLSSHGTVCELQSEYSDSAAWLLQEINPLLQDRTIVASRELVGRGTNDDRRRVVTAIAYLPREIDHGWECEICIRGLASSGQVIVGKAGGIDSFQALLHAMEQIAIIIYTSEAHIAGELQWLDEGNGYGLPLPERIVNQVAPGQLSLQILHVI